MAGTGRPSWPEFFAKAPLSDAARRDLVAALRQEPRLPARQDRRAEAGAARADQLPGVPAHAREDEPRRAAVLPRPGRTQQQARRHDAGARSGARRPDRLRRPRPAPTRSRSARAASRSTSPTATPRSRDCWCRGSCPRRFPAATTWRRSCKAPPVAYDHLDDAGTPTRIRLNSTVARVAHRRPAGAADRCEGRVPARRQDAPGAGRERRARLLQRDDPEAAARAAGRTAGRADLLGQGADALHQRAAAALDVVQAAGRRQHQRAGHVPPEHAASIRARPSAATRA